MIKPFLVESLSGIMRWEWVPTLRKTSFLLLFIRQQLGPTGNGGAAISLEG